MNFVLYLLQPRHANRYLVRCSETLPASKRYLEKIKTLFRLPPLRALLVLSVFTASTWVLSSCNSQIHAQPLSDLNQDIQRQGDLILIADSSPLHAQLQLETIQNQLVQNRWSVPASIQARPENLVHIAPPVAGRIIRLHHQLGDEVKIGDPLITLESADISTARAEYNKANAILLQAQAEFERQKQLLAAEIAAQRDFELAQQELAAAQADLVASKQYLQQLGVPVNGEGGRLLIRSPINGKVIAMEGAIGRYWNDDTVPIMIVADLSTLWLNAQVAERDLAKVSLGQPVFIHINAFSTELRHGKVDYIGQLLDPQTRSVAVQIALDNADGKLRPGLFATAEFMASPQQALLVPANALLQNELGTLVFVEKIQKGENVSHAHTLELQPRQVKIGTQYNEKLEISSGLQAGERVLINGGVLLQ